MMSSDTSDPPLYNNLLTSSTH